MSSSSSLFARAAEGAQRTEVLPTKEDERVRRLLLEIPEAEREWHVPTLDEVTRIVFDDLPEVFQGQRMPQEERMNRARLSAPCTLMALRLGLGLSAVRDPKVERRMKGQSRPEKLIELPDGRIPLTHAAKTFLKLEAEVIHERQMAKESREAELEFLKQEWGKEATMDTFRAFQKENPKLKTLEDLSKEQLVDLGLRVDSIVEECMRNHLSGNVAAASSVRRKKTAWVQKRIAEERKKRENLPASEELRQSLRNPPLAVLLAESGVFKGTSKKDIENQKRAFADRRKEEESAHKRYMDSLPPALQEKQKHKEACRDKLQALWRSQNNLISGHDTRREERKQFFASLIRLYYKQFADYVKTSAEKGCFDAEEKTRISEPGDPCVLLVRCPDETVFEGFNSWLVTRNHIRVVPLKQVENHAEGKVEEKPLIPDLGRFIDQEGAKQLVAEVREFKPKGDDEGYPVHFALMVASIPLAPLSHPDPVLRSDHVAIEVGTMTAKDSAQQQREGVYFIKMLRSPKDTIRGVRVHTCGLESCSGFWWRESGSNEAKLSCQHHPNVLFCSKECKEKHYEFYHILEHTKRTVLPERRKKDEKRAADEEAKSLRVSENWQAEQASKKAKQADEEGQLPDEEVEKRRYEEWKKADKLCRDERKRAIRKARKMRRAIWAKVILAEDPSAYVWSDLLWKAKLEEQDDLYLYHEYGRTNFEWLFGRGGETPEEQVKRIENEVREAHLTSCMFQFTSGSQGTLQLEARMHDLDYLSAQSGFLADLIRNMRLSIVLHEVDMGPGGTGPCIKISRVPFKTEAELQEALTLLLPESTDRPAILKQATQAHIDILARLHCFDLIKKIVDVQGPMRTISVGLRPTTPEEEDEEIKRPSPEASIPTTPRA